MTYESEEEREEAEAKELLKQNEKTKQLFENAFDESEDFDIKLFDETYQSGQKILDDASKVKVFNKLVQKAPVSCDFAVKRLFVDNRIAGTHGQKFQQHSSEQGSQL